MNIFDVRSNYDVPLNPDSIDEKKTTPMERVLNIFKLNEFGLISPELNLISQVACMSTITGFFYGGFMNTRYTYTDFVQNNQATIYKDHLEAKKKLQDKVTNAYAKGGLKWGWRLCYFSTTYVAISTCVATYRNKNGILDHSVAGLITGLSYKLTMGPRAWIVGAGLGCALGTFAGTMTFGMLALTGVTMDDVRQLQYRMHQKREDAERASMQAYIVKEQLEILTTHDARVGQAGKTLASLPDEK